MCNFLRFVVSFASLKSWTPSPPAPFGPSRSRSKTTQDTTQHCDMTCANATTVGVMDESEWPTDANVVNCKSFTSSLQLWHPLASPQKKQWPMQEGVPKMWLSQAPNNVLCLVPRICRSQIRGYVDKVVHEFPWHPNSSRGFTGSPFNFTPWIPGHYASIISFKKPMISCQNLPSTYYGCIRWRCNSSNLVAFALAVDEAFLGVSWISGRSLWKVWNSPRDQNLNVSLGGW